MDKYNFVGKGINEAVKKSASSAIDNRVRLASSAENFPDEIPKTKEDAERIRDVIDSINDELIDLGLSPDFNINPQQIHLVSHIDNINSTGLHQMKNQQIQILKSRFNLHVNPVALTRYLIFQILSKISTRNLDKKMVNSEVLIHESIHFKSYQVHKLDVKNKSMGEYREGYKLRGREDVDYFRGFNEAVVQKTTEDILMKSHKSSDASDLQKTLFKLRGAYTSELLTVNQIVNKIAKIKNQSKDEVWERFKKGQFTGEMMHLRDVENAYGPGSLRILASMNTRKSNKLKKFLYYTYFSTDSKFMKDSIARILLSKEPLIKKSYNEHIKKMDSN